MPYSTGAYMSKALKLDPSCHPGELTLDQSPMYVTTIMDIISNR